MNLAFASFPRICLNFLKRSKLVPNFLLINRKSLREITDKYVLDHRRFALSKVYFITYSISLFGLFNKDEQPEDKLITTIKRSILCINREEYDRAEQMLHLALKMAQDLQNKDGITYVYDVMANLAMEREQFKKAEKLFADVMRRLISDGLPLENPKILHISSKLAHIADLQGDLEKAKSGFIWTLGKLEECLKSITDDVELKELWALTTNWFGQLLMKEKNFKHAEKCFKDAYECFTQIHGSDNSEAVTLLNDLSVVCTNMEKYEEARGYISKALNIARSINDTFLEATLLANLGLLYLQEGLIHEAESNCSHAWKIGKNKNYDPVTVQAEYCLKEININKNKS